MEGNKAELEAWREYNWENRDKSKILIFKYDPDHTAPEDLQQAADAMNEYVDFPVLFIPKYWDYEYMTKEEIIARLHGMIDFINITRRDDE